MNHWDQFVRGLHGALLISAGVLVWMGFWLVRDADGWIQELHRDTHRNLVVIGGAAADLQKTLALERQAAAAQLDDADTAAKALRQASMDLDVLVLHTDDSLNGQTGLLPELAATVSGQNIRLAAIERQAEADLATLDAQERQLGPLLAAATQAAQSAAVTAGDPHIAETMARLDDTAANVAGTTAAMQGTAQDIQKFVHRETTPVRGTWNVIKGFLKSFAGPAAQVATASKP